MTSRSCKCTFTLLSGICDAEVNASAQHGVLSAADGAPLMVRRCAGAAGDPGAADGAGAAGGAGAADRVGATGMGCKLMFYCACSIYLFHLREIQHSSSLLRKGMMNVKKK